MKKKLVILSLLITLLVTGCQSNNLGNSKLSNEYEPTVRGYSLELLSFNTTKLGFKGTGSKADLDSADYLVEQMKEIGLTNVVKEEIVLDGWEVKDALLKIFCGCNEEGELDIKSVGYYPTNMSFDSERLKVFDIADGSDLQYQGKDVKNNLVILSTTENLIDNLLRAKENGAIGVLVSSDNDTYVYTHIIEGLQTDLPVLSVSKNTLKIIRQFLKDSYIEVELTAESKITENVKTYNVVGELKGKISDSVIYITASRDGIYKDFMGSAVSIAELLTIADELIEDNYKPESTIKFVVTTGQEWGKVGKTTNEGIKAQLETKPEWVENAKAVIVLDGSKPLENTVITSTQGSKEVIDFLTNYTKKFEDKGYRFSNVVSEIASDRVTEALVWQEKGVPTILQAEPKNSAYMKIEKTSGDISSLTIDNEQLNFLVDYYMNIVKEVDRVKGFK